VEDGWKVGFYTGEDKPGLVGFLEGDVDVLIGSSAIGTRHRRRRPLPSRRAEVQFTRTLPGRFATVSPEAGTREFAGGEKQGELKGVKCP
jgi:hypothetical protein